MKNKQTIYRIISLLLTVVAVAAMLGVVEVNASRLLSGENAGHYHYLWQASIVFVVCMCGSLLTRGKQREGQYPDFYSAVVWCLILLGGVEALSGLRQLYGFTVSNHS